MIYFVRPSSVGLQIFREITRTAAISIMPGKTRKSWRSGLVVVNDRLCREGGKPLNKPMVIDGDL